MLIRFFDLDLLSQEILFRIYQHEKISHYNNRCKYCLFYLPLSLSCLRWNIRRLGSNSIGNKDRICFFDSNFPILCTLLPSFSLIFECRRLNMHLDCRNSTSTPLLTFPIAFHLSLTPRSHSIGRASTIGNT